VASLFALTDATTAAHAADKQPNKETNSMKRRHIHSSAAGLLLVVSWVLTIGAGLTGCATPKPQTAEEKVQASASDLREVLESTIQDAGRRQQMLVLVDRAEADLKAGAVELAGLLKEQERLNADYNASRDEFRKLGDRMQAVRKEYRAKTISARQSLASLATDQEWKKITSRDRAIFGQ